MKPALHAEWTKLRTVASPLWLLLGAIAATVALSAAVTSVMTCGTAGCNGEDTTKLSLTGVELGQALVAILAAGVIGGEYGSGLIRTTLAAMPHRPPSSRPRPSPSALPCGTPLPASASSSACSTFSPSSPGPSAILTGSACSSGRADERRARHPGHQRSPRPAHQPLGRSWRPRRLGRHRAVAGASLLRLRDA